ncbi:MAG: zinc ribbon domain-containing protein [Haloarculaceae archaeon]
MADRDAGKSIVDTLRLVGSAERWVVRDAVLGYVLFAAWFAVTGTALGSVVDSLGRKPLLAVLAVLWLVLPGVVVAWRVFDGVTNLRGNVDGAYRSDRPGLLLVIPLVVVAAGIGAARLLGPSSPVAAAVLSVGAVAVLVRTVAYGLRVYSFSRPYLLRAVAFVSGCGFAAGVILQVLAVTGRWGLVPAASGLGPSTLARAVPLGPLTVPPVPWAVVVASVGPPLAYLAVQLPVSAVVRWRSPVLDPAEVRAGQRVPATATVRTGAAGRESEHGPTDGGAGEDHDADEAGDEGGIQPGSSGTRVFQPDADGDDGGSPLGEDTDVFRPGDGDETAQSGSCPACGRAVDGDDAFCPTCGIPLQEETSS